MYSTLITNSRQGAPEALLKYLTLGQPIFVNSYVMDDKNEEIVK